MADFVPSPHLIRNQCICKPDVKGGFLWNLIVIKLKAVNCERHAMYTRNKEICYLPFSLIAEKKTHFFVREKLLTDTLGARVF